MCEMDPFQDKAKTSVWKHDHEVRIIFSVSRDANELHQLVAWAVQTSYFFIHASPEITNN